MWMYETEDDCYLTTQEQDDQYLHQNSQLESSLWAEWVGVVCGWDKIDPPTSEEWAKLKANFYHGKRPIDSVTELKKIRGIT